MESVANTVSVDPSFNFSWQLTPEGKGAALASALVTGFQKDNVTEKGVISLIIVEGWLMNLISMS